MVTATDPSTNQTINIKSFGGVLSKKSNGIEYYKMGKLVVKRMTGDFNGTEVANTAVMAGGAAYSAGQTALTNRVKDTNAAGVVNNKVKTKGAVDIVKSNNDTKVKLTETGANAGVFKKEGSTFIQQ
jgi:hypothetical protein